MVTKNRLENISYRKEKDSYAKQAIEFSKFLDTDRYTLRSAWETYLCPQRKRAIYVSYTNAVKFEPLLAKRQLFEQYKRQWKRETMFLSNVKAKAMNLNYQRILTLGEDAIPWMLEDFQNGVFLDWFWALAVISGDNPIPEEIAGNVKAMAEAWIKWGQTKNYLKK